MIPQERRDSRSDQTQNNQPQRDFTGQSRSANAQAVNVVFREPVQKVLEKVRNEPFFKWLNKMAGDPVNRNQNLYCHIRIMDTLPRIAKICGIIWNNWSEKGS